ncbi:MAG: TatD family hydrolase [Candidatus Micrarchaeota archaeon]|nr:TatD family hydrolase [Candidatus Micrarchaeota archaeon]
MSLSYADSHIHIYEKPFELDTHCLYVVPTYSIDSIKKAELFFYKSHENKQPRNLIFAFGIAPQELLFKNFPLNSIDDLETSFISKKQFFDAIGEIGLDLHYGTLSDLGHMQTLFERQLILAEKYRCPVIIHSRKAEHLIFDIVKNYNVKGIMHAFGGSYEDASKLVDLGFMISIPPLKSKERKKIIKQLDMEYLLIETDYPFIAKSPDLIHESSKMIAEYKGLDVHYVETKTLENLSKLFKIDMHKLEFFD